MPPAQRPQQRGVASKQDENKSKVILTPIGRACFVHVWEPFAFKAKEGDQQKEPGYSLILVFDNKKLSTDPAWKRVRSAVGAALVEKFGQAQAKALMDRKKLTFPWRGGIEYEEYGPPFEANTTFIRVSTRTQPGIVDARSQAILDQTEFYPGCYARASVFPWAYDSKGNKGCTLLLNNVQKASDGERLAGGRANAEDEFEPLDNSESGESASDLLG